MTPEEKELRDKKDAPLLYCIRHIVIFAVFAICFGVVSFLIPFFRYIYIAVAIMAVISFLLPIALLWGKIKELFDDTRKNIAFKLSMLLVVAFGFAYGVFMISGIINLGIQKRLTKNYKEEVTAYLKDQNGFQALKKYAKNNFGVDLLLNTNDTQMIFAEQNSPAWMEIGWHFCQLGMSPKTLYATYNLQNKALEKKWIKTVEIHELGHCLDESRDLESRVTGSGSITRSIAPIDRKDVVDLDSYMIAENQNSTKQWREVEADLIAMAYVKLTFPESANELISELIKKRNDDQHRETPDKTHDTGCWLTAARNTAPPPDIKTVVEWADNIRSTTDCKLHAGS